MFLTVLGCNGPYPSSGGATSGYLLEAGDETFLLDCGSGVMGRLLQRTNPADLTCVFLSHLHFDHMSDLGVMQYYLQSAGKVLPLYLPPEDHSAVRRMLDMPSYRLCDFEKTQTVGCIKVETQPVRHPVPCRAMKITDGKRTLVYTGDTAEGESLIDFCKGADLLIADAAFMKNQWHEGLPHMSAEQAGMLAKKAGVKKLMITHFPPNNVPALLLEEAKNIFENTIMALPGQRTEI